MALLLPQLESLRTPFLDFPPIYFLRFFDVIIFVKDYKCMHTRAACMYGCACIFLCCLELYLIYFSYDMPGLFCQVECIFLLVSYTTVPRMIDYIEDDWGGKVSKIEKYRTGSPF